MLLAERRPSGKRSAVQNVRHLLFAEQPHLGRFLPDGFTWSGLGLAPHFLAKEESISDVDTEPTDNIEAVLAAWDAVHAPIREPVAEGTEGLQEGLEGNLEHLRFHIGIIESLLDESSGGTEGASAWQDASLPASTRTGSRSS